MTNTNRPAAATALINTRIAALVATGVQPVTALRAVVGDAVVDQMIGDLYDILRAKGQLAEAVTELDAARATFLAAKTSKARRAADENLNFWIGKVAMLTAMVKAGV